MAEKIFLDLDEEIIFVIEKVKRAEGERVILVVPERANLLGSGVSLKLLAQEVALSNKLVVLVTEDEIGIKLAEKAPIVSVLKINEITEDTWSKASEIKEKLIKKREFEKKHLLEERREQSQKSEEIERTEERIQNEKKQEEIEPAVEENSLTDMQKPQAEQKKEEALHELKRLEPQMVDVGGFAMAAGGDIAELKSHDKPDDIPEKERVETFDTEKDEHGGIVGQDLSSMSYTQRTKKDNVKRESGIPNFGNISKKLNPLLKNVTSVVGGKSKLLIIGGGIIIIFLIISYFVLPTGSVTLQVESQDIKITKEVIADTSISTLDVENLTVPAKTLEAVKDRSGSAAATGKEETGDKATGQVTIYNLSETQTASIPSGTVLESVESGLKYTTVKSVTVEKKRPDDDPELPGLFGSEDVGIVAENFGKEYNTSDKEEFRVTGFELDIVYGKNFSDITGGSSKKITVISQEDYTKLKKSLVNEIKPDILQALKDEAGVDRELLTDTIKYKVINEDPTPGVGVEADTLNLSVTVKGTGLSFSKEDIDTLAQQLVESDNGQAVDVEEFKYSSKVKKTEGQKIYIALNITGVVTPSIDTENIKKSLAGKTISSANEYLEGISDIKDYTIELSPGWLPSFLKHFPGSTTKITIEVEKIST